MLASDVVEPAQKVAGARFVVGSAEEVIARRLGHASRKLEARVGSADEVIARRLGHASRKLEARVEAPAGASGEPTPAGASGEPAPAGAGGQPAPAVDAVVLDPPRTGALEAMAGIAELGPPVIVYVSCDPATLARDAEKLVAAGYRAERAWPVDLMPQTSHIEVVLRLTR